MTNEEILKEAEIEIVKIKEFRVKDFLKMKLNAKRVCEVRIRLDQRKIFEIEEMVEKVVSAEDIDKSLHIIKIFSINTS